MTRNHVVVALAFAAGLGFIVRAGAQHVSGSAPGAQTHMMLTPEQLRWGEPPAGIPAGARVAVLRGNPDASGEFTVRIRMPAGYRIMPHWHPTDENMTVLSGTLYMGTGDTFDEATAQPLAAGAFAFTPAHSNHWVFSRDDVELQIDSEGPFAINYLNPVDDPRNPRG